MDQELEAEHPLFYFKFTVRAQTLAEAEELRAYLAPVAHRLTLTCRSTEGTAQRRQDVRLACILQQLPARVVLSTGQLYCRVRMHGYPMKYRSFQRDLKLLVMHGKIRSRVKRGLGGCTTLITRRV